MAKTQSGSQQRDAIDMLLDDHKRVQKLFKDFEKTDRTDEEAMRELVVTACVELQIHSMLEEEIFYPAVRAQIDDDETEDVLNEAEVEHEAADEIIAKLQELAADDPMYAAYFTVLAEYVKHHVREEENELFPRAKKMTALDLPQLGEDMRRRRDELFAEMESEDSDIEDAEEAPGGDDDIAIAEDVEETEDEQEQIDISRTRH